MFGAPKTVDAGSGLVWGAGANHRYPVPGDKHTAQTLEMYFGACPFVLRPADIRKMVEGARLTASDPSWTQTWVTLIEALANNGRITVEKGKPK